MTQQIAGQEEFEKVMRRIRPLFSLVMNTEKTYYLNHNTGNMWETWQRGQEALIQAQKEAHRDLLQQND